MLNKNKEGVLMPVRNHITYLQPATVVAKEQNDAVQKKVTAEMKKPDPKNAEAVIQKHIRVNPNTKLDTFEKQVASGQAEDPEKKGVEASRAKEISTDQALTVAHPADSQAAGGKEVEDKAKPK
jgi:hypothetical protein